MAYLIITTCQNHFFSFQQHITSPSLLSITNINLNFYLILFLFFIYYLFPFHFPLSLPSPFFPSFPLYFTLRRPHLLLSFFFLFLQASVKVLSARWVSRTKSKKSYFDYHFGCKQRFYYYFFSLFLLGTK